MREERNREIGQYYQEFLINYDMAKKFPSLVSSTTLIVYRSLLGLENRVEWAWKRNLSGGHSDDSRLVPIAPSQGYMSFPYRHDTALVIKPFIIHFINIRKTHIPFVSLWVEWP